MHEIIRKIASEADRMKRLDGLPLLPSYLKDHEYDPIMVSLMMGVPSAWSARSESSRNESSGNACLIDKMLLEVTEAVEVASAASSNPDKMPMVEEKLLEIAAVCVRMLSAIKK